MSLNQMILLLTAIGALSRLDDALETAFGAGLPTGALGEAETALDRLLMSFCPEGDREKDWQSSACGQIMAGPETLREKAGRILALARGGRG